nr:RNA polymerase beta'' subunit [Cavernulicola chilensis]
MKADNQKTFLNRVINKNELKSLMSWIFSSFGATRAAFIVDKLKDLGFSFATKAGISLSVEDLRVPPDKNRLLKMTQKEIATTETKYIRGEITAVERFQKVVDTWNNFSEVLKDEVVNYFKQTDPLNPVYIMAFSGARGNLSQVRQLVGMRGLMADPQGQIIDLPITSNFREGLTVTEYLISSYGARKGLVDTSLRTADSGYLTRRLVDVAQDIIVREEDCGTFGSILIKEMQDDNKIIVTLKERIMGRTLATDLYDHSNNLIAFRNDIVEEKLADGIVEAGLTTVYVRSPLTCESNRSVCQNCYGFNLAHGKRIDLGEAIGIIAAQSIGEPGTQLTMRTFHTGGVFTGKFAKSIRAPFDGTVHYTDNIDKVRAIRTRHGEDAFVVEKPTELIIQSQNNYNETISLNVGMTILLADQQFVKKNRTIAEASTPTRLITEKATKDLLLDLSGEVYFDNIKAEKKFDPKKNMTQVNQKGGIIWILSGELYNFPLSTNISVVNNTYINKGDVLATSTILNENGGFVRLKVLEENTDNQEIDIITDSVKVEDATIYKDILTQEYIVKTEEEKQFNLRVSTEQKLLNSNVIAELIDSTYKTSTGGIIKYSNLTLEKNNQSQKGYQVKGEGTILWIPEETHEINKDISVLLVEDGDYIEVGTEIINGIHAGTSGLVEVVQNKDILKEIIIRLGEIYKIENSNKSVNFEKNLYYPGEHIIDDIFADRILYVECIENRTENYLLMRPVEEYFVPQDEHLLKYSSLNNNKNLIDLLAIKKSEFKDGEMVKSVGGVNLLSNQIILKINPENPQIAANIELVPNNNSNVFYSLQLVVLETLKIKNSFGYTTTNKILVEDGELVNPKTRIVETYILSNHAGTIALNPNKESKYSNKLLVVSESNIKTISIDSNKHNLKQGSLVKIGDKLTSNIIAPESGQIVKVNPEIITLRIARPYLVSSGAVLYVNNGDFVDRGDRLASLVYERVKTRDIVQGLPRIEEILEARKPKEACKISQYAGKINILYEENYGTTIQLIHGDGEELEYFLGFNQKPLVSHQEQVNTGEVLTEGPINPHEILNIFFHYYKTIYSLNKAAKLSLQKVQLELLKEVQEVYQSQGVEISDKHVEVIIRQMTSKVIIDNGGDTNLLPGELIELSQIEEINKAISFSDQNLATYYPVLLGITKASLNTNSFISAASFQETTRVLAEAAIEGKVDWLKGLKENVIVGKLIPAGTGFNTHNELNPRSKNLFYNQNTTLTKKEGIYNIVFD